MIEEKKEDMVIEILNKMIGVLKPFNYNEINMNLNPIDEKDLLELEKQHPEVGLKYLDEEKSKIGSSMIAIMATVTDVLVGKRLAFIMEDDGLITGVCWASCRDKEDANCLSCQERENK